MELNEPSAKYLVQAGHKQTELGKLPVDWEVIQLGNLDPFVTSGSRGWARYYSETGSTFLRITNLSRDTIHPDLSDLRYVNIPANDSEGERTKLVPGDVLISITADVGIVGYVSESVPTPAFVNQHIALVRFSPEKLDTKYLSYFLAGSASQSALRALADSGAKAGMNLNTVLSVKAALPPTSEEQKAISDALTDADALIESLEQLLAKKRRVKQGAMQELLSGQRRLPGFSEVWLGKKLSELASIQRGASPRPIDDPVWFDENSSVGWVRISDVTQASIYLESTTQRLSEQGIQHSRPVPKGSLIMSICATVGRPVITKIDTCIHDGFVVFDRLQADQMFVYYVLRSIEDNWSRHGQTGSQMNLNTGLINSTVVHLPPTTEEQAAIATILSDMDTEITALKARLTKVRQVKQGMAQALLTGRIRLV